jgi:hypothetical protein
MSGAGGDIDETVIRPRRATQPTDSALGRVDDSPIETTIIRLISPEIQQSARAAGSPSDRSGTAPAPWAGVVDADRAAAPERAGVHALRVPGVAEPVPLDVPAIVGRRPGTSRLPESPQPRRVVVPPECREVSGRHARFDQVGDSILVTDLGSSNGIVVHLPSGSTQRLRPGESSVVLLGSVISLGDGIDITLLTAPTQSPRSPT